jgi:hypothetical protein
MYIERHSVVHTKENNRKSTSRTATETYFTFLQDIVQDFGFWIYCL